MNYEEKYKQALERARKLHSEYCTIVGINIPEEIFPELKEDEDERIRKKLICFVENWKKFNPNSPFDDYAVYTSDSGECDKILAWLEKQGEQPTDKIEPTPAWSEEDEGMLKWLCRIIHSQRVGKVITLKEESELGEWMDKWLNHNPQTKQGEQSADNFEPKLHEGDWIISNNKKSIYQVIEVKRGIYVIRDNVDNHVYHIGIEECEKSGRLWDVSDAKDGDVLAYVTDEEDLWIMIYRSLYEPYEGHVHYHALLVNDNFSDKGTCCICIDNLKPATKEQRDLLFQKIKEAGYKWNAEKKELKRICEPKTLDTDKVIDKACEWIHTALYLDHERSIEHRYATLEELLNDFKKAMKGGES